MDKHTTMSKNQKSNLNTFWGELIIEELTRCGIDYFCLSPGSRSTPLTVAVARNPKARHIICYDERGSAYHAIGYARATQKPAVVITSSGSAVANLYPAVIEASVDNLPLILLTADRPPELHQTNANQTIEQIGIFGSYPRWQFNLPCPDEQVPPEMVLTTIDQAMYQGTRKPAGPVHLNCMFREPLAPTDFPVYPVYTKNIKDWQNGSSPFTVYQEPQTISQLETLKTIADLVNHAQKGLLAIGKLKSDKEREAVLKLVHKLNWPVYADVTSGLRLTGVGTHVIRHFDQELLSPGFNKRAKPEIVLQLGGRLTSKRFPQFLDDVRPQHYLVIKDNPGRYDPLHGVTMHVEADIPWFCQHLEKEVKPEDNDGYTQIFLNKAQQTQQIIETNVVEHPNISEAYVARAISRFIPDGNGLFLSNSMPVRDMDLYGVDGRSDIKVAVNRGTSGIDGVIASAAGFAVGQKSATTLLIGDLAFMHDVSSLSLIRSLPVPLVIVVINNRGGGIFHFLPIVKSQDVFEEYFATPHDFLFKGLGETFGLDYYFVGTKQTFDTSYQKAIDKMAPAIIEVQTDREENLALRRKMKFEILKMLEV